MYLRPRATLNFDLLTPKLDPFMPLLRGSLAPIDIKVGSFFLELSCSQICSRQTNGQIENITLY